MKSPSRVLVALCAASALVLTGCSSGTDDTSTEASASDDATATETTTETGGICDATVTESSESDSSTDAAEADAEASEAALNTVTLSDGTTAPTMAFAAPLAITAETALVADSGSGDVIEDGQVITFNYLVCDLVTGEKLYSTWGTTEDLDTPMSYILSSSNFGEVLSGSIAGSAIGTRLLWAQPGVSAEESYTGAATNGYLYALSLTDAQSLPESASGTEVTPTDDSLPTVTMDEGVPAISVPSSFTDPTELVVQPLIEGDGDVVESGQTIAVKYSGWLTDGTQFDSSWPYEGEDSIFMFDVGLGSVIEGWDTGLVGQTAGSRVLLVIPSEMGYGETGSGDTIPADSTLIFVVDILGVF